MNNKTKESLKNILGYVYIEEQRDWNEAGRPENHIFKDIMNVSAWLFRQGQNKLTALDYSFMFATILAAFLLGSELGLAISTLMR